MDQEQRQGRRRNPGNPGCPRQRRRLRQRELFLELVGQPLDVLVFELARQSDALLGLDLGDLSILALDVTVVLRLHLCLFQGHQRYIRIHGFDSAQIRGGHGGAFEIVEQVRVLRDGFSASGFESNAESAARDKGRSLQCRRGTPDRVALCLEFAPALTIDQAEFSRNRRQSQVRVVLAQSEPVLRAAAEHAVGFIRAERDEVVHQHANVRLMPLRRPRVAARHLPGGVQPGQQSLRRRLFVTCCAVDLASEIKPRNRLRLKRWFESARVEKVVLDSIARPGDPRLFETLYAPDQRELHFEGQARGYAVRIEFVRVEALRFHKDLVRGSVGETHDLVLNGRAIARSDAFDFPRVHRRAVESAAYDPVRLRVRGGDVTGHLARMLASIRNKRHRRTRFVAPLRLHAGEVDGIPGDPRRCAGLEPVYGERQRTQALGKGVGGWVASTTASVVLQPNMDASAKKRPCRQHDGGGGKRQSHRCQDALDAALADLDVDDRLLEDGKVLLRFQHAAYRVAVKRAVRLGARRAHGGALARIQRAELNPGRIRRQSHRAAHRIDLLDQVTLADAAYRGIAGHLPKGLYALGQQKRGCARPRRRQRGFRPGVAAADNDDIVGFAMESHGRLSFANGVAYFPMQKLAKISPNRSSAETRPTIAPRWSWASRRSSATSSPWLPARRSRAAASASSAAARASRCRARAVKMPSPAR